MLSALLISTQDTLRQAVSYEEAARAMQDALQQQQLHIQHLRIQGVLLAIIIVLMVIIFIASWEGLKRRHKREISILRASLLKERLMALNPSQQATELINQVSEELTADQPVVHLSAREKEVAEYCAQGLLAKEIAFKMGISTRTVETHKNNIFHKLGINSTEELVKLWGGVNCSK